MGARGVEAPLAVWARARSIWARARSIWTRARSIWARARRAGWRLSGRSLTVNLHCSPHPNPNALKASWQGELEDLGSGRSELAHLKASWQDEMQNLGILPRRPPSPRSAPARLRARCGGRGAARRRTMPMSPQPPEPLPQQRMPPQPQRLPQQVEPLASSEAAAVPRPDVRPDAQEEGPRLLQARPRLTLTLTLTLTPALTPTLTLIPNPTLTPTLTLALAAATGAAVRGGGARAAAAASGTAPPRLAPRLGYPTR